MRFFITAALVVAPAVLAAQQPGKQPSRDSSSANAAAGTRTVIRGLYVNRWAAQSRPKMRSLIALAHETGLNALVIDLKDEFGLNYHPTDSVAKQFAGNAGAIPDIRWLLDTMKAVGLVPIARMVTFKDSVTARARPDWTILGPDGHPWRDKQGLTWVNPYNRDLWDYDLRVATELAHLGFAEIQFDYIRFPEPYPSLPKQSFPGANGVAKQDALAAFLKEAHARLAPLGVRTTADVFGLTTTVKGALEVGQQWEALAPVADVLLPMVYPSHYVHGSFGIQSPNSEPYQIVKTAVSKAVERNTALGLTGERVRPYLQAFTLGKPAYGDAELAAQFKATHEAGAGGFILWNPGSKYELYRAALIEEGKR
ncbi:MAG TPA: putative glycoside hydrolase [Gemmatimonadaceae bacterium]|nr:putative glycoside hydrolase [Gemmatimonadaceae bacterium]